MLFFEPHLYQYRLYDVIHRLFDWRQEPSGLSQSHGLLPAITLSAFYSIILGFYMHASVSLRLPDYQLLEKILPYPLCLLTDSDIHVAGSQYGFGKWIKKVFHFFNSVELIKTYCKFQSLTEIPSLKKLIKWFMILRVNELMFYSHFRCLHLERGFLVALPWSSDSFYNMNRNTFFSSPADSI